MSGHPAGDIACQRIGEGAIDVLIVHGMGRSEWPLYTAETLST